MHCIQVTARVLKSKVVKYVEKLITIFLFLFWKEQDIDGNIILVFKFN